MIKFKVLTSFLLTFSFFAASLSGVILFLTPKGRIANWVNWTSLGLDKEQWGEVHTVFVALMLITGLLHLFWFNWKVFWSYIQTRSSKAFKRPTELVITLAVVLFLWLGAVYKIQPVYSLAQLREVITDSYETESNEPPVPHAEEFTLAEAAEKLAKIDVSELIDALTKAGYKPDGPEQELGDLAEKYGVSPKTLIDLIKLDEQAVKETAQTSYHTPGQGKMTVAEYCAAKGIDPAAALDRLKKAGFKKVTVENQIKELSGAKGIQPSDVARIIHEGN